MRKLVGKRTNLGKIFDDDRVKRMIGGETE